MQRAEIKIILAHDASQCLQTQKRLGQLQKYVDRQKFRKQGGYSQKIGVGQQSGTIISAFKDVEIWKYIYNTKSLLLVKNVRIFTHIKLISFLRDIVNIVYALRTSKETELYCHGYSHENEQRIRLHDFAGLPLIYR